MAIIGVNRPEPVEKKEKKDPWEDIIKGLQVAQSITGIATNVQQYGLQKLQKEKAQLDIENVKRATDVAKQKLEGYITPEDKLNMLPALPNEVGARKFKVYGTNDEFWGFTPVDIEFMAKNKAIAQAEKLKKTELEISNKKSLQEIETHLRDKLSGSDFTKALNSRVQSYADMESAAQLNTPAGDMMLLYGYLKTADPNTGVKEGEYANAQKAGSIPDWMRNLWDRSVAGTGLLQPHQKQALLNVGKMTLYNSLTNWYDNEAVPNIILAQAKGVNPDFVVTQKNFIGLKDTLDKEFGGRHILFSPNDVPKGFEQNISGQQGGNLEIIPQAQATSDDEKIKAYLNKIPSTNQTPSILPTRTVSPRR